MTAVGRSSSHQPRAAKRHVVSLEATLSADDVVVACAIQNLSLGGALITTSLALAIGRKVKLVFELRTLRETIDLSATVRWAEHNALGLQFEGLRAREMWALGKFFEQLQAASKP